MERYFVSNIGRLYAGKENPNPETYKEISHDEFCGLLNIAEFAWGGWYNIYANVEEVISNDEEQIIKDEMFVNSNEYENSKQN